MKVTGPPLTAGALMDVDGGSVVVDLTEAAAATIAAGDFLPFLDGGTTGTQSKGSINDVATLFAGTASATGLSASSGVLSVTDLTALGVSGSANQMLTDDGDGTVTSQTALSFNGSTLAVTGAFTTTTTATIGTDLTVTGDIIIDDGGSIKEAGGTAAITIDSDGEVSKIGQDSPSDADVLTWDNTNSKVVWSAASGGGADANDMDHILHQQVFS